MNITQTASQVDNLNAEITGRTQGDKKVTVKIKQSGENVSQVNIRVGFWGDESESRAIMQKIKDNL